MTRNEPSPTAGRKVLIGFALVGIAIVLAAAGYRLGKHLAERDTAATQTVPAPARDR